LEVERRLRVFPPLEYVWYFAQKVHFLTRLHLLLPPSAALNVQPIPMMPVPTGHSWKAQVQDFARQHQTTRLVFKREFSDCRKHVLEMDVNALSALPGRGPAASGGFRWMVQPWLCEFSEFPEMRMYVLNGKCSFGVMTRFDASGDSMTMVATAPGRRSWLEPWGGRDAALAAEYVVAAVRQDQVGAGHFLRVDLVRRSNSDGGWWLNELEFFGNAQLILEVFDNATDLLQETMMCTKEWIRSIIRK
jgi:hypothetical protein